LRHPAKALDNPKPVQIFDSIKSVKQISHMWEMLRGTLRYGCIFTNPTWPVPALTAQGIKLACICPQVGDFVFVSASDGDGRTKRDAQNA